MDTTPLPAPDDEDTHTIGRKSARRPRIELITRGERRRIWTPEQKREIVLESLDPGTTPTAVARKHAISSGLLYTWRQQVLGVQGGDDRDLAHVPRSVRHATADAIITPFRLLVGSEPGYSGVN